MRFYNKYDLYSSLYVMKTPANRNLLCQYLKNIAFKLPITRQPMFLLHINLIVFHYFFLSQEVIVLQFHLPIYFLCPYVYFKIIFLSWLATFCQPGASQRIPAKPQFICVHVFTNQPEM